MSFTPQPATPVADQPVAVVLRKLGWIEGENLVVERASADLKIERLAGLAKSLVGSRPEVIWTDGSQAAIAAGRATRTIPIVFNGAVWPVETGLVDSLARPGRNLTGATSFAEPGLSTKRLEFLREIVPSAKRLAVLGQPDLNDTLSGGKFDMPAIWRAAEERLGFVPQTHQIRSSADIDTALSEIAAWRPDAMNGTGSTYLHVARQRIADFALRHRLPSVFAFPTPVEAGGLLSYGPAPSEAEALLARSLEYVDRILRGARPNDLPVQRPSRFDLLINMKTAKALGLKIPQSVLVRADRLIE